MNGLPDWDQISIGEQVHVLKMRMDRLAYMEQRLSAIEAAQGRTHYEGDDCPGGHRNVVDGFAPPVTGRDVARWRRIEEAAREVDTWDPVLVSDDLEFRRDLERLNEALKP